MAAITHTILPYQPEVIRKFVEKTPTIRLSELSLCQYTKGLWIKGEGPDTHLLIDRPLDGRRLLQITAKSITVLDPNVTLRAKMIILKATQIFLAGPIQSEFCVTDCEQLMVNPNLTAALPA